MTVRDNVFATRDHWCCRLVFFSLHLGLKPFESVARFGGGNGGETLLTRKTGCGNLDHPTKNDCP